MTYIPHLFRIMGDMNIDLLKFEVHRRTDDYLNNLFSHGFLPVISKPTRVTNTSATLIDHIYTNDITSSFRSGIIINDVADHLGTFCIFHDKTKKIKPKQIKKRIFNKANTNTFYRKLENTNFSDCLDLAYNKFMDIYLAEFDASFPMREVSSRAKSIKRQPWLLTLSINKGTLFSLKLHNPTDENIRKYKIYNKVFNKLKRKLKTLYFKTILEENRNNSRKCWSILKSAFGKTNDKSSFPLSFTINNSKISDKSEIVEGFNNFFSNIGLIISYNVLPSKYPFSSYMSPRNMQSFFLDQWRHLMYQILLRNSSQN